VLLRPFAEIMPSSAMCPLATNRIDGRVTASQIAAASLASFFAALQMGLTREERYYDGRGSAWAPWASPENAHIT